MLRTQAGCTRLSSAHQSSAVRIFHTNHSSAEPFSIFDPRASALKIDEVIELWCHNDDVAKLAVVRDVRELCATLELIPS